MNDWIAHKLWRWIADGHRRYIERTCNAGGHNWGPDGICRRCRETRKSDYENFSSFDSGREDRAWLRVTKSRKPPHHPPTDRKPHG